MYMLDTNICIYIMKKKPLSVFRKLKTLKKEDIVISSITLAELNYGVEKSESTKNLHSLIDFIAPFDVIPFTSKSAETYGVIRSALEKAGIPIGAMDLLIAAHALSERCVMVTNNERGFSRVESLTVENWVKI